MRNGAGGTGNPHGHHPASLQLQGMGTPPAPGSMMGDSRAGKDNSVLQLTPGKAGATLGAALDVVAHLHAAGQARGAQQRRACLCRSHHLSFSFLKGQESPWTRKQPEGLGQSHNRAPPAKAPCF